MAKINVSIPDSMLAEVDCLAKELELSRSGFVQEATARYVAQVRDEREREERRRSIAAAMERMRDIASRVPAGADTTELIREDRDSDHGRTSRE